MKVNLLFFGIATDYAATANTQIDIDEKATVKDLKSELEHNYPKLKNLKSFAVAVNETYASNDLKLHPNDVIAIIPPVSGG